MRGVRTLTAVTSMSPIYGPLPEKQVAGSFRPRSSEASTATTAGHPEWVTPNRWGISEHRWMTSTKVNIENFTRAETDRMFVERKKG